MYAHIDMDIKTLLLKSLSLEKQISGSYRKYFGKSCYIIKYTVRGKILSISDIKCTRKHKTWSQHIKQKCNFYMKRGLREKRMGQSKTVGNIRSISTQNSKVSLARSAQQTIPSIRQNLLKLKENKITKSQTSPKSCQTDFHFDSKGVQCKYHTSIKGTQTDENIRNVSTQVQIDSFIAEMYEKSTQTNESLQTSTDIKDLDVIIYILNEIGETVMDQSKILNNTNKILDQVRQINNLKEYAALRKSLTRNKIKYKILNENKKKSEELPEKSIKRPTKWKHISAQTDNFVKPETISSSSQTIADFSKSRILPFLKKQKQNYK